MRKSVGDILPSLLQFLINNILKAADHYSYWSPLNSIPDISGDMYICAQEHICRIAECLSSLADHPILCQLCLGARRLIKQLQYLGRPILVRGLHMRDREV
jgi:hypothetical protein